MDLLKKGFLLTALVASLLLSANALSCLPCDPSACPDIQCPEGVGKAKDICWCCDVCAGMVGADCGGWYDVDCDEGLVCAKDLLPSFAPRPAYDGGMMSSGSCQESTSVHMCQLLEERCNHNGNCVPDGDSYTCQCDEGYGGDSCEELVIIEPPPMPWFPMLGGWGQWTSPNEEVEQICKDIRNNAEEELESFEVFIPVTYQSQVVAGMNYKIKLDVGKEHFVVISVFKGLDDSLSLDSAEWDEEITRIVEPPEEMIPECPFNQEWQECGTACPLVCGEEEPLLCTMNCVIGCQCPPGHWQDKNGFCVEEKSQCPSYECPSNQEWQECGTACPLVCGEPEPFICTMNCVIGCQCPPGHWQNEDGSCVEEESQCAPSNECPSNQEWQECGTACPLVCGEPEPFICTMNCVIGCQCPPGHWQNEDGSCVEEESQCASSNALDPCEQPAILCHADAQCVEGFVGGWQCLCNEGFTGNGEECTSTALDPCEQQAILCHADAQCVEGFVGGWQCLCNEGFTGNGEECTSTECPFNQEWQSCGTACPLKCGEESLPFCTYNCVVGCQCPPGQWEKEDGSCVELESECT